jgi:hypothetical protein
MADTTRRTESSLRTNRIAATMAVVAGALLSIVVGITRPSPALAHGGGLDANGCHYDRKNGGYHCHRAPAPSNPAPSPVPAPSPAAASVPLTLSAAPTTGLAQISGTFVRFDASAKLLVIQDAIAVRFDIALRDDTSILNGQRLDDYLESNAAGSVPWSNGQALTVNWRPSADRAKRVAVSIR